jgi:hypothetical protein
MPTAAATMLQSYMDAETALLKGQSIRWGERMLTRADLAVVQAGRREWEGKVAAESAAAQGRSSLFAVADFSGRGGDCEGFRS